MFKNELDLQVINLGLLWLNFIFTDACRRLLYIRDLVGLKAMPVATKPMLQQSHDHLDVLLDWAF